MKSKNPQECFLSLTKPSNNYRSFLSILSPPKKTKTKKCWQRRSVEEYSQRLLWKKNKQVIRGGDEKVIVMSDDFKSQSQKII